MVLLFWQLVAPSDFSPLTKIHQAAATTHRLYFSMLIHTVAIFSAEHNHSTLGDRSFDECRAFLPRQGFRGGYRRRQGHIEGVGLKWKGLLWRPPVTIGQVMATMGGNLTMGRLG